METNYDADDYNGITNEGEPSRTSIGDVCLLIAAVLVVYCPISKGDVRASLLEGVIHIGMIVHAQVCRHMWICDWNVHLYCCTSKIGC